MLNHRPGDRSIEHTRFTLDRRYPAPLGRVWEAWADPAVKVRWFAESEEDWELGSYELDFREGGIETSSSAPPGGEMHHYRAVYWEIVAHERIVYTYEMRVGDVRLSVSLVTVELRPDGDGTHLTLTEHGAFFDGHEDPAQRRIGTEPLLDALGREIQR